MLDEKDLSTIQSMFDALGSELSKKIDLLAEGQQPILDEMVSRSRVDE